VIGGGGIQKFWTPAGAPALPRIARAEGLCLWDTQGRRYLDVTSGPIAVNLGHANPRVLAAMQEQAARVCFAYPSAFESEADLRLGAELCTHAGNGFERAFFVSGGSEAVEKCLQFARRYALATGEGERRRVISRNPSYHGSTQATMALSADPAYAPFLAAGEAPLHVPAPFSYRVPEGIDAEAHALRCAEALRATIIETNPRTVLAFILEPVMGFSGGATRAPAAYYRRVREICDEFGVLLIYDEIVSGAGRTGRFLAAHEWPDVRPDLVVLAKGIGGGYCPLAGFLAPARLVDAVANSSGFHVGHTHKAQPLACAVGLAVLRETLERNLVARARAAGERLRSGLRDLQSRNSLMGDVRGVGLLNAIELVADPATKAMLPRDLDVVGRVQALARDRGLLLYGRRTHAGRFGDWLFVTPPLVASDAELDEIVAGLGDALHAFRGELRTARLIA
jgi:adenosylmethionine-8-amino-7-oxononanoate aminotransferase